jgi:hypothetical protein
VVLTTFSAGTISPNGQIIFSTVYVYRPLSHEPNVQPEVPEVKAGFVNKFVVGSPKYEFFV